MTKFKAVKCSSCKNHPKTHTKSMLRVLNKAESPQKAQKTAVQSYQTAF